MSRRHCLLRAAAALACRRSRRASRGASRSRSFPAKPVKLVIAFPAGGPTDITMRQLADNASRILGQPVIVENKPGAGGTLPAQALQTSPRRRLHHRARFRSACSASATPPRSTGIRSRTSAT